MGVFFLKRHPAVSIPQAKNTAAAKAGTDTATDSAAYQAYSATLGIDIEKGTTSFDARVRKEYRFHTAQYWFVATLANGLLWTQIVIGAALTALGATRTETSQTATIYLGAASTIIAGLLTYFKSRNQPNRARQFRQALRGVRNSIDDEAKDLEGLSPEAAREVARGIMKKYNDALAEAAANYPDLWVTLNDLRKFLPSNDPFGGTGGESKNGETKADDGGAGSDEENAQHKSGKAEDAGSGESDTTTAPSPHKGATAPQPASGTDAPNNKKPQPPPPTPRPSPPPAAGTKPHTDPDTKPTPTEPHNATGPADPKPATKPQPQPRPQQPQPAHTPSAADDLPTDMSPLDQELSEVRNIATHIDLDADFSHPDDNEHDTGATAAVSDAANGVGKRVEGVAGIRRVGGFTLLE